MARLAAIYRHPVKSLGEEALSSVRLEPGRAMPWDRVWAVTHGKSEFNPAEPEWVTSRNHVIQSFIPKLAQVKCVFEEDTGVIALAHPDLGEIWTDPDEEGGRIADWIAPLAAPSGPAPYRLIRLPGGRALTDFPETDLSIGNLASLRALEEMAGQPLEHIRFRMNLWVDGLAPWAEFDWEGGEISVGAARLSVIGRVTRCNATNADPATGARTTDLTRLLHGRFGHMDFGVYARVAAGGVIATGDEVAA